MFRSKVIHHACSLLCRFLLLLVSVWIKAWRLPNFDLVRRTLSLALVKSHLSYGTEVWSPHDGIWVKSIEGVQRRATLWILRSSRGELTDVERLKRPDNILPLRNERFTVYWKRKCDTQTLMWIILPAVETNQVHYPFSKHPTPKYPKASYFKEFLNYGIMTSNQLSLVLVIP